MQVKYTRYEFLVQSLNNLPTFQNDAECLIWPYSQTLVTPDGNRLINRLAYELTIGPIQDKVRVVAQCGTRGCYRPSHLKARNRIAFPCLPGEQGITAYQYLLWSLIGLPEDDSCLLWTHAGVARSSGGHLLTQGVILNVRRLVYTMLIGDLSDTDTVTLSCGNSLCYRPGHILRNETSYEYLVRTVNECPDFSQCMNWPFGKYDKGYGRVPLGSSEEMAHRLSFMIFCGDVPPGQMVCHSCDTPACYNPCHLWLGTGLDNQQDCVVKGRKKTNQGERSHFARLTESEILQIRSLRASGLTYRRIAERFLISPGHVGEIVTLKSWAHIKQRSESPQP